VGASIKPATPPEVLFPLLDALDLVLVMSVEPGFGGQEFIPSMLPKIAQLRRLIDEKGWPLELEVDGGIKVENIGRVAKAGANVFVSGSGIFQTEDYRQTISKMREQIQKNIISQEDARNHRWKNVITRALGNKLNVDIDLNTIQMQTGDLILLCTDGLSTMLDDSEILKILIDAEGKTDRACKSLIQTANDKGGLDNITVILLKCKE
jgi:hypothetical protein